LARTSHTRSDLNRKAVAGLVRFLISLAAFLFIPAWTLAVFSVSVLAITVYLMRNDPSLLERRLNSGPVPRRSRVTRSFKSSRPSRFSS
jgi:hypothetical protein